MDYRKKDATEVNVLKHQLVRSYLQIKIKVTIDYFRFYDRKSRLTKHDICNTIQTEQDEEVLPLSPAYQIDDTNIPIISTISESPITHSSPLPISSPLQLHEHMNT